MVGVCAVLAAAGLTLAGVGASMWAGRVPPNRWVGFRTPRTVSDRAVWYAANAIAGRDLAVGGALTALLALLLAAALPTDLPLAEGPPGLLMLPALPLWAAALHTFWAVSAWLADHDAAIRGRHGQPTVEARRDRSGRADRARRAVRDAHARAHCGADPDPSGDRRAR